MKRKCHDPASELSSSNRRGIPLSFSNFRLGATLVASLLALQSGLFAQQTVGTGTITQPAQGPAASFGLGQGATLIKNWDFGADGTIKNMADLDAEFFYNDQFNTIDNSQKYGSVTLASGSSTALYPPKNRTVHPLDNNPANRVRQFGPSSLKTYLVLFNSGTVVSKEQYGSTTVSSFTGNVGNGSFMAKYATARGGSLLGYDVIWETRVRMVVPPSFWFAIWTAGQKWAAGAEFDLVETFGKNGSSNADYWHSATVSGYGPAHTTDGYNWGDSMNARGVPSGSYYRGEDWHIWTMVYRADNTVSIYLDGIEVQDGLSLWTRAGTPNDEHLVINYLFDGSWGHRQVDGMQANGTLATSLIDKYYEWDYSRIYLRPGANLAWKKTVTASSAEEPASNAVDGDFKTAWKSSAADNQWLTVDLGQSYNLGRMVLHWDYSGVTRGGQPVPQFLSSGSANPAYDANYAPNDPDYATSYRIEVSANGSTWTQVHSVSSSTGGKQRIFFSSPVTGRYVRLTNLTRSTTAGATLNEIEIYKHHDIAGTTTPVQALPIVGATATNTQGTDVPANSYDGNDATIWVGKMTTNAWIQWDLGTIQTVDSARFKFVDWREYYFTLQVSTNGQQWKTVLATQKGLKANGSWQSFRFNAPVSARYVRYLTFGSDVNDYTSLKEVEFLGWEGDLVGDSGDEGNLFFENFANGAGAWSLGTTAPWSIVTDGGDEVYEHAFGWWASAHNLAGENWENYELAADVKFVEWQLWSHTSLYGSYSNGTTYYRLALQRDDPNNSIRLYRRSGAGEVQIGSASAPLTLGTWYTVRMIKNNGQIAVLLDDTMIINVQDASPLPAGKIGLNASKQRVRLDNISVTSVGPATLFSDDFTNGSAKWSSGTTAPWSIGAQGGNFTYNHAFTWQGSALNLAGSNWLNYAASFEFKVTSRETWSSASFYASYVDSSNNYRLALQYDETSASVRLYKRLNGVETQIAATGATLALNTTYSVTLKKDDGRLTVALNGVPCLDVQDSAPLAAGRIGLSVKKQVAQFDNFLVTTVPFDD